MNSDMLYCQLKRRIPALRCCFLLLLLGCSLAFADTRAEGDGEGKVVRKRFEWNAESASTPAPALAPASAVASPGLWVRFVEMQKQMREHLSEYVSRMRDGDRALLWPFLLVCLLYGVIHAVGPGHGKTVVAGYFLARKGSWKQGALLGMGITLAHVFSAVFLLYLLYGIVRLTVFPVFESVRHQMEKASYLFLILTGIAIILLGLKRLGSSSHEHSPPLSARTSEMIWLALITGLVPCPAVALVVLFCLLQGLVWQGLAGALAIGIGMAITNVSFGLFAIAARKSMDGSVSRWQKLVTPLHQALSLIGGSIVLLLGLVLFLKV